MPIPGKTRAVHGELRYHADRGRLSKRLTPTLAVRALAVVALLLAVSVVLALALEASEPGPAAPTIRPLPQNLFNP
jgi:hypothetical protein